MSKKKNHYIDNEEFLKYFIRHIEDETDKEAEDYIANAFLKITYAIATRPNFASYTYKDDMISDALMNCWNYRKSFDYNKSNNPFAYFTTVITRSFIRTIEKEKKHQYTKYKLIQDADSFLEFSSYNDINTTVYSMHVQQTFANEYDMQNKFTEDFLQDVNKFVVDYEEKIDKKKQKIEKKKNSKKRGIQRLFKNKEENE